MNAAAGLWHGPPVDSLPSVFLMPSRRLSFSFSLQANFKDDATALAELRAELAIWCRLHHVRKQQPRTLHTYPCQIVARAKSFVLQLSTTAGAEEEEMCARPMRVSLRGG